MLVAAGLGKRYGTVDALQHLDMEVRPGQIVGLVGNNGAGKSTALKLLTGILEPTTGTATWDGRPTLTPATRANLGFLPEDSPLYEDETPLDYLAFFGSLYGLSKSESRKRGEDLLRRLRLGEEHWKKHIGELSKGSARKVAIARALLHDPAVLILDEPQSGLDPQSRSELDRFLSDLRRDGKAILLSAHNLTQVEALCDRIVVLHQGKVAAAGTLHELQAEWGRPGYELVATLAFRGSNTEGSLHSAVLADLDAVADAVASVRTAGGAVVSLMPVTGRLSDVLERAGGK